MSERKPLTDEQLDAIWKEMLKPNSRKPLTLEELRKMVGKPVWIQRNDPPHDGKWDLVDCADTENPDKTLYTKSGVTYSEYGKYFTAYAYEPPLLDRSAWEPCGACKSPVDLSYWLGMGVVFCPHCGRPLNDAAWEMLEKRLEGAK